MMRLRDIEAKGSVRDITLEDTNEQWVVRVNGRAYKMETEEDIEEKFPEIEEYKTRNGNLLWINGKDKKTKKWIEKNLGAKKDPKRENKKNLLGLNVGKKIISSKLVPLLLIAGGVYIGFNFFYSPEKRDVYEERNIKSYPIDKTKINSTLENSELEIKVLFFLERTEKSYNNETITSESINIPGGGNFVLTSTNLGRYIHPKGNPDKLQSEREYLEGIHNHLERRIAEIAIKYPKRD